MLEIDVGDLMRQDELKGGAFVLAEEREQSARQIDIATGMREGVDYFRIEDCEVVFDFLPCSIRQNWLGQPLDPLKPWPALNALVEVQNHVVQLPAEAHLV